MDVKKKTVYVKGMHCPSCDILVKDSLGECANISAVKADYKTQKVEITYSGNLNKEELNKKISQYGYSIADKSAVASEPFVKRLFDTGSIAVILFIVYYFAKELNFLPENIVQFSPTSYWAVFVLGLVASTSTCMATSGALFMSTIGTVSPKSQVRSPKSRLGSIIPAISFNVGRVLSYGFFGYIVGMLGKSLASNAGFSSALTVFVAFFMVLMIVVLVVFLFEIVFKDFVLLNVRGFQIGRTLNHFVGHAIF
jgi:copper chaperone CopZ/cytochrome c biogenesis protein CcdA